MKEIQLTQGQFAQVDDADFEWLSQHKWYARWDSKGKCYYAVRSEYLGTISGKRKYRTVSMHRTVLGLEHGDKLTGDHIATEQTLNNTRKNLRIANHCQQAGNTSIRSNNSTGFKGVSPDGNGYRAQIQVNGKKKRLGTRSTPEAAHALYIQAANDLHGDFARVA